MIHQVALPWHWGYSGLSVGDTANELVALSGDPNVSIQDDKAFTCDVRAGRRRGASTARLAGVALQGHRGSAQRGRPTGREPQGGEPVSTSAPDTEIAIHRAGAQRMGFFTDTTVCIGCKACEVACKQWNDLPADGSQTGKGVSYDHTGDLSASTWRHVRFVELFEPSPQLREEAERALDDGARAASLPAIPDGGARST